MLMSHLPFTVDLWAEDELSIERDLARIAELSIARMAFDAAAVTYPERLITLRGPGAFEAHSPQPRLLRGEDQRAAGAEGSLCGGQDRSLAAETRAQGISDSVSA
jgi:hypothetical protein